MNKDELKSIRVTGAKMKFTEDFIKEQLDVMEKFERAECSSSPEYLAGRNAATQNYADALRKIVLLEYQLEDWTNNGWAEDYKARIAELEEKQRWIPVSERLPLLCDSKAVLVYTKSGETYSGLYLGNNEWTGLLHDFREGEVTHWMPLPEPPKERE